MEGPQLLSSIPQDEWVGREVLIRVGQLAGYPGKVLNYENDWVTLEAATLKLKNLSHNRRANELSILHRDAENHYYAKAIVIDKTSAATKHATITTDENKLNIDYDDNEEMLSHLDSYFEEMEEEGSIDSSVDFVEDIDVGMRVDVLDEEHIWNPASICRVNKDNTVAVTYDGWEDEYNEDLPFPSPRIAKIFTYTKEFKCLAEIFLKRSKGSRSKARYYPWPCRVQVRMAHPGQQTALETLAEEDNVFVSPYGEKIPLQLQDAMINNGMWLSTKKIRQFSVVKSTVQCFQDAIDLAIDDDETDAFPYKRFDQGSLFSEKYEIQSSAELEENMDAEESNNLELSEGMRVEILDACHTWNAACICSVNKDKTVTVRYDGRGGEYDEDLPCASSRIAKIFTHTKEVKCIVELFPKSAKGSNRSVKKRKR